MGWLTESLDKWIASFFIDVTLKILELLATMMNLITDAAIDSLGLLPEEWNVELYELVKSVHSKVIIPIALLVFSFMMTKELIEKLIDNNNLKQITGEHIFKWIIRIIVTLVLLTKSFEFIEGILSLSKYFVQNTTLSNNGKIDFSIPDIAKWKAQMKSNLGAGTSFLLMCGCGICGFLSVSKIVKILIAVFKRMFDMLFLLCFGSIPMAMSMNEKYEQETWNFLKRVVAVTIQVAIFMLLIRMLDVVWKQLILKDFAAAQITYSGIIVSLLKMFAYISCISIGFDKTEEYSERFLGLR